MTSTATLSARPHADAGSGSDRIRVSPICAVWLLPLLYPLSLQVLLRTAQGVRGEPSVMLPAFLAMLLWSMAGPLVGWLTLNYVDRRQLDRREHRLAIRGALFAAFSPALFVLVGSVVARLHYNGWQLTSWSGLLALAIAAAAGPASISGTHSQTFRRVHGYAALVIVVFALSHIVNHVLAIVSLDTHTAAQEVLRVIYRQPLVEALLLAAIAVQASTGITMVWRTHLRRSTVVRNLQMVSGLYLMVFFASHLLATIGNRQSVDTTFAWATSGSAGMLAEGGSARLLPYYLLAVSAWFIHLGCQAQWNLARYVPKRAARAISYGIMGMGALTSITIAMAACGIHLW